MTGRLRGRRWITPREYAEASGKSLWTVRWEMREGRLRGRDLNAGTRKRPRWQVLASELRKQGGR